MTTEHQEQAYRLAGRSRPSASDPTEIVIAALTTFGAMLMMFGRTRRQR